MAPHPLDPLSVQEVNKVRELILGEYPDKAIYFRDAYLEEPLKAELTPYLDAEHAGKAVEPPQRRAFARFDVIGKDKDSDKNRLTHESVFDINTGKRLSNIILDTENGEIPPLAMAELVNLVEVCSKSQLYKDALAEFELPEGFEAVIEPWPYGGTSPGHDGRRYFQGLVFAQDTRSGNPDSNFYSYPIPIIPVLDAHKQEIVRIERLATGGKGDSLSGKSHAKRVLDHCKPAEYVPELLPNGVRKTVKELNVIQPDGPSFTVSGQLVEWQGWRFRLGFNPREGATLHDIHFNGRSVLYRLSVSEMTVPYADPRHPFPRKQAFDFGDGGAGNCANDLSLGCDCLGVIKYFDSVVTGPDGHAKPAPNVVCLHEQDNGIGWKHTNWRTGRAVVTRLRELVVQFIITLANYEYIFAYKFDQAGGITVETRATGIVSVVNIDPGKTSEYGNVVSPGALAQNHQHIFCVRIDPAIDGHQNTVVVEESKPVPIHEETNPAGNLYAVHANPVTKPTWVDASGADNRVIRIINPHKTNPVSGKNVSYKFTPAQTQLLLAHPDGTQNKRALFAQHHVWVTKYKDGELYAGGRYTLQSQNELGGVADAVKRNEDVQDTDVVVWNVYGITHNPRVEDWPVMPTEILQLHIKPSDFFTANPAIDVPSSKNSASRLAFTNGSDRANGSSAACCKS